MEYFGKTIISAAGKHFRASAVPRPAAGETQNLTRKSSWNYPDGRMVF